ncbi:MAG: (d)CMP kinase [Candidatus Riflebacteria bacterium]|nr:(d)CMP kinase [Candidatus Riflebacteria bacterium]
MGNTGSERANQFVVAIDGPAGAGKSTVAKLAASRLGFSYLDTGAMYRAVTYKALQQHLSFSDKSALASCAANSKIEFEDTVNCSAPRVKLDSHDVTDAIRDPEVSRNVSEVASEPEVRSCMTSLQREIGSRGRWVVDGRDIGTVVFPEAQVKIFLTASIEERAKRRFDELVSKGYSPVLEELISEIAKRDGIDSNRKTAPLKQAENSYYLDTTSLTIDQVVDKIYGIVTVKKGQP